MRTVSMTNCSNERVKASLREARFRAQEGLIGFCFSNGSCNWRGETVSGCPKFLQQCRLVWSVWLYSVHTRSHYHCIKFHSFALFSLSSHLNLFKYKSSIWEKSPRLMQNHLPTQINARVAPGISLLSPEDKCRKTASHKRKFPHRAKTFRSA